jgi:hypothetical protein
VTADVVMEPGVVVHDAPVGEDLLTLDFVSRSSGMAVGGAGFLRPRGANVLLHELQGSSAPLTIDVATPPGLMFERRGDAKDGLVPVEARWSDGALLVGRVRAEELREIHEGERFALRQGEARAPAAADECGLRSTPRGITRGVRRIPAGTLVYAEPGRGEWARVTEPVDLEIEYPPDAHFASIVSLPGIVEIREGCAETARAWIDLGALSAAERAR